MKSNRTNTGFTLAEVLIVLGIIGTIAAMTIPTVVTASKKQQTVASLKKAYSTISQAIKQSENDNGKADSWDWGTDSASVLQSFKTNWAPYLNISEYCNSASSCGYNISTFNCLSTGGYVAGCGAVIVRNTDTTTVVLADGTILLVRAADRMIFVDINGAKGPNTNGKDVFFFIIDSLKGLMPYDYTQLANTINTDCSVGHFGQRCAAKIITLDNWQINDDYPLN